MAKWSLVFVGVIIFSSSQRCWSDVVVTEFPRDDHAAGTQAVPDAVAKSDGKAKPAKPRGVVAAEYLAGLRHGARRSPVVADNDAAAMYAGTIEIKLDMIPTEERLERTQLGYRRLCVPQGTYGVEGHGVGRKAAFKNGKAVTPMELARWIRHDARYTRGMAVYLLVCETGKGERSYAQRLSDELQADVFAPTEKLWIHRDGSFSVHTGPADKLANGTARTRVRTEGVQDGRIKAFHPALRR